MPKTLLLADDSVTIQKVVGISFASEDVNLVTVDNGDDALLKARESHPDLVLADVVMPGMNGYEVCEALKADPALRHVPVVLLTGTFEAFDEERARRAGAAAHVSKPFEAQRLVDLVQRLLTEAPPPAAATPAPAAPEVAAAAPPVAAPVQAEAPLASPEDSFDFFDDELGAVNTPVPGELEAAPAAASPSPQPGPAGPAAASAPAAQPEASLDVDTGDFAFGEPEPADAPLPALRETPSLGSASPLSALPDAPGDYTVAILPEEDEAPAAGEPEPLLLTPEPELGDTPPLPGREDGLDFAFESGGPDEDLVDAGDLAQDAVVDPSGVSGFDISSSDLGDPLATGPTGPVPATAVEEAARREPEPSVLEDLEPLMDAEPLAEPFDDTAPGPALRGSEPEPTVDLAPGGAPEPERPSFEAPAAAPAAPPEPEPQGFQAPPEPSFQAPPEPRLPEPERAPEPREWPEPARVPVESGELRPEVIAAALEPALRARLHDTLEKIAWESFSEVTEKIVQQAIERVEKVAWEVVPQLAETLVREEIRKMKGERR